MHLENPRFDFTPRTGDEVVYPNFLGSIEECVLWSAPVVIASGNYRKASRLSNLLNVPVLLAPPDGPGEREWEDALKKRLPYYQNSDYMNMLVQAVACSKIETANISPLEDKLIFAADTVCIVGDNLLNRPHGNNKKERIQQALFMIKTQLNVNNRTDCVRICLHAGNKIIFGGLQMKVVFKPMSEREIDIFAKRFLEQHSDVSLDCAGAFPIVEAFTAGAILPGTTFEFSSIVSTHCSSNPVWQSNGSIVVRSEDDIKKVWTYTDGFEPHLIEKMLECTIPDRDRYYAMLPGGKKQMISNKCCYNFNGVQYWQCDSVRSHAQQHGFVPLR